jgi:hypothetical protein
MHKGECRLRLPADVRFARRLAHPAVSRLACLSPATAGTEEWPLALIDARGRLPGVEGCHADVVSYSADPDAYKDVSRDRWYLTICPVVPRRLIRGILPDGFPFSSSDLERLRETSRCIPQPSDESHEPRQPKSHKDARVTAGVRP